MTGFVWSEMVTKDTPVARYAVSLLFSRPIASWLMMMITMLMVMMIIMREYDDDNDDEYDNDNPDFPYVPWPFG